ncbi:MAG: DNA polymerase III subunit epsilon [Legionellales bacterium]|jgi:DNA polymerase III subunit epsilon|nr:DNA polymerase III subunit epsilon [Legionellales bacterium]
MARQVVLDTETTGRSKDLNRIIEIGAVELIDREQTGNHYHVYINPEQEVEKGALAVHGLTNQFLQDKPLFPDVVDKLMGFISGSELIMHNAVFDVGFIEAELRRMQHKIISLKECCQILDTLPLARKKHPGQRNSLDALCKRYEVDNSGRSFHGALLDSYLLADVYLRMTGGQNSLFAAKNDSLDAAGSGYSVPAKVVRGAGDVLSKITLSHTQLAEHNAYMESIAEDS